MVTSSTVLSSRFPWWAVHLLTVHPSLRRPSQHGATPTCARRAPSSSRSRRSSEMDSNSCCCSRSESVLYWFWSYKSWFIPSIVLYSSYHFVKLLTSALDPYMLYWSPVGDQRRDSAPPRPRQDEVPQDRQRQQGTRLHRVQGRQAGVHRRRR